MKSELESVLVVVEAKKPGSGSTGIAQILCYLAGVQDARKRAGKHNCDVFGMTTDSQIFRFVVLRSNRRAYTSTLLEWRDKKSVVIAFLDQMLRKAIEMSPHTTPVKNGNKQITNYGRHLKGSFAFGGNEGSDEEDEEDDIIYEIIVEEGASVLKRTA